MKLDGLLAVFLCLVLGAFATSGPLPAQTRTDMLLDDDESAADPLIEALNKARTRRGVEPLVVETRLSGAAERLAEDAGYETWSEGDPIEGLAPRERAEEEMTVQGYEPAAQFAEELEKRLQAASTGNND